MKNMYFEGNLHGLPMITELEYWCLLQQRMKFCVKNRKPVSAVTNKNLMNAYGFSPKDVNPKGCEGERENRIYYTRNGQVDFTENPLKKMLIRLFYSELKYECFAD